MVVVVIVGVVHAQIVLIVVFGKGVVADVVNGHIVVVVPCFRPCCRHRLSCRFW